MSHDLSIIIVAMQTTTTIIIISITIIIISKGILQLDPLNSGVLGTQRRDTL